MKNLYRMIKIYLAIGLLVIGMAALTACSHDSDSDSDSGDKTADLSKGDTSPKKAEKGIKKVTPICPQVAIVRELQSVQDYGREKPEPGQLVASGQLQSVAGDCAYGDNGIDIQFELSLSAQRGPRLGGTKVTFPYFVAVVDPQQNILNKDTSTEAFEFSGDKKQTDVIEKLHVFIPLAKDQQRHGPDYQVLIGYQLTQEQLDNVQGR